MSFHRAVQTGKFKNLLKELKAESRLAKPPKDCAHDFQLENALAKPVQLSLA